MAIAPNTMEKAAKVCLIITLLSIIFNLLTVLQTEGQLVSPLIPQGTIWLVAKPFIVRTIEMSVLSLAALIFFFYNKYLITIIICVVAIIVPAILFCCIPQ